jgi:hypothetical protein
MLAQSSSDYQDGKPIWNASQIGWDSAVANAQTVLTGSQMDALRALRQSSAYEQAINSASNQAAGQAMDNLSATLESTSKGPQ